MKRTQEALQSFKQALTACPAYLPALEGAAQIEYATQSKDAPSTLSRVLTLQPGNVTAHAMMAVLLRQHDHCPEALPHFDTSQTLFVQRPDLVPGYASCLAGDRGQQGCTHPIPQHPANHSKQQRPLQPRRSLQWKTGAPQDALLTLSPLLEANQYEPAFSLTSRIAEESGDTPRAVELLRRAIQLSPDKIDNYLDFTNIAFNQKSFQVGIDRLNTGLQRNPNAPPLYLACGILEVQLTRNDAAIADFEYAHHLEPRLSFAVDALGIMNSQQHDNIASLALFQAQAKVHPDDPLLQYLLVEQLSQINPAEGTAPIQVAIAAAEKATRLDPHYQPAHDLLATLYIRSGQQKLAIRKAEAALSNDPNDESAMFQELVARRRSGDTAAIETLTARLKAARIENSKKQHLANRYRLQDETNR